MGKGIRGALVAALLLVASVAGAQNTTSQVKTAFADTVGIGLAGVDSSAVLDGSQARYGDVTLYMQPNQKATDTTGVVTIALSVVPLTASYVDSTTTASAGILSLAASDSTNASLVGFGQNAKWNNDGSRRPGEVLVTWQNPRWRAAYARAGTAPLAVWVPFEYLGFPHVPQNFLVKTRVVALPAGVSTVRLTAKYQIIR